ncbi:MAG TPA: DUF455 family protein [Aggregatilineales bacterium]|nr:DUF455 family protein [Aggregatilineales bacterium]
MASELTGTIKNHVTRLARYQALETYAARVLGGWLAGIARWEVKQRVAYHLWEDLQISRQLRTRLWELRVNQPDRELPPQLQDAFHLLAMAQADFELLAGVYLVLKAELEKAYQRYIETTFDIYDHPSVLVLRHVLPMRQAQTTWARRIVDELADTGEKRRQVQRWMQFSHAVLAACGGIDGNTPIQEMPTLPPAYGLLLPFVEARRDDRFEVTIGSPAKPAESDHAAYVIWQFSNYVQEMQAAETLATILWEVEGVEWEFYYDIARHCWDEVRHSEIGQTRLGQLGYHIADFPSAVGSYAWRQLFDPLIRYCALTYVIEADSFKLKHASYQHYLEQGDMESAQPIMYDIMDETMHVRFGQKWVPPLMKHYGYAGTLDDLITACRQIVATHSVAPAQREAVLAHSGQA